MFKFNTQAKAKLVHNKKLGLYKLVVAFNVYETRKQFDAVVYKFPVQAKCDFVSGDIAITELGDALKQAEAALRTNNITLVA
jgi:hypothetical protein